MAPPNPSASELEANDDSSASLTQTSSASVLDPDLAAENQDQHVLLWGRFWGEARELGVAFSISLNLDDFGYVTEEFMMFRDSETLESLDPDQPFLPFKQTFSEHFVNADIPEAMLTQVRQSFRSYLDSSLNEENLIECFREQNDEEFADHAYEIVNQIFPKGEFSYHFRAKLSTPESHGDDPAEKSVRDEDDSDDEVSEEDYLSVNPVTSPMNGDFPADLSHGKTVYVRITGEATGNLPEDLQSDDEDRSIPLKAIVRSISADVDLPKGFEGDAEDYWELTVKLLEEYVGRCFVHKNTQIKVPDSSDNDESLLFSPALFITSGLILLGCLLLAYVIFGV